MATIRLIKRRIRSAGNISQITKAMELVAASKMKKAQAQALSGSLYAQKIFEMVAVLSSRVSVALHPLLSRPKTMTGKRLIVLITTNKGLCGGLNTTLLRFLARQYPNLSENAFIVLGKKGGNFLSTMGASVSADFSDQSPFPQVVPALTQLVIREFTTSQCDAVDLVYSEFHSALKHEPRKKTILPLTLESVASEIRHDAAVDFLIEPSASEVFHALLPHYVENQIRDAILQGEASEHSARMIAMRNATDNAVSLMEELTLLYNKARQEKITYEISDMVTARLAVEQ